MVSLFFFPNHYMSSVSYYPLKMVFGDADAEAVEGEKSQKELDEEIKKKKERQV